MEMVVAEETTAEELLAWLRDKPSAMVDYLATNADSGCVNSPEGELVLAVIGRTLDDAVKAHRCNYSAWRFQAAAHEPIRRMREGVVELWGALLGLNPVFVRESLQRVYPWAFA